MTNHAELPAGDAPDTRSTLPAPSEIHEGVLELHRNGVQVTLLLDRALWDRVEASAKAQLAAALALPGLERVVVTPDVHTGYAVPIGFAAVSSTHLYPDTVGPDPACSVSLSQLDTTAFGTLDKPARRAILDDLEARIAVTHRRGRHRAHRQHPPIEFDELLAIALGERRTPKTWVAAYPPIPDQASDAEIAELTALLRTLCDRTRGALRQLGSIGGGNHFLEVQEGDDGLLYVMAHFGSRGLGAKGAEHFFEAVRGWMAEHVGRTIGPNDLLWVPADTSLGRQYLLFQQAMLEYASANHAVVQRTATEVLREHLGLAPDAVRFLGHIPHNFIERRGGRFWHRKGATPAYDNDGIPLLIPGSMATASYLLEPGPNAERFGASVPHGAGRRLSRGAARRQLDQEAADRAFDARGVMGNFRHVPLDESSGAYKDVDAVIEAVVVPGVARVVQRLQPRLVLKGE